MGKLLAISLVLASINLLLSCEGYSTSYGVIKDKKTGLPLDCVLCEIINEEDGEKKYTDTIGRFEVQEPFGSCISECPDIIIRFSKANYETLEIKNPSGRVFYLIAQKK